MFPRNKRFCVCWSQKKKRNFQSFKFWYLPMGGCYIQPTKSPRKFWWQWCFAYLLYCAKPGLWIVTKFGSLAIPWNDALTTKKGGITMKLYGKMGVSPPVFSIATHFGSAFGFFGRISKFFIFYSYIKLCAYLANNVDHDQTQESTEIRKTLVLYIYS